MFRSRTLALLVVIACLIAACGRGDDDAAPTTTAETPPTTVPAPAANTAPLTGLPVDDPAILQRPALVVKIDNAPRARPQAGLNQADVVIEEKVEDGVTRFFTIFHSAGAESVGPVRSARSTDIALAALLGRPLFAYSGANAIFQRQIGEAPLVNVGIDAVPGAYRRQGGRPAPYNLFSSTGALLGAASGAEPPRPLFAYAPEGAAGGGPVPAIRLEYLGDNINTIVEYRWEEGRWARYQDGRRHVDADGAGVSPVNVVVQFVDYVDTGLRDRSNTAVPEAELIGGGELWVLSGGRLLRGTWARDAVEAPTRYRDEAGREIALAPGQTWMELTPTGQGRPLG